MNKKVPIGVDNFCELVNVDEGYLFVDKTLLIKELLDNGTKVSLVIRPRRWGKTLNMSMLRYFFAKEVNRFETKGLFDHLNIARERSGHYIEKYQGKYPVIFISFKDIKKDNFIDFIDGIRALVHEICNQYPELECSEKLSKTEKEIFFKLLSKSENHDELCNSLKILSVLLCKHYGSKTVILIDEYDTPLNAAYNKNHFEQVVNFFKAMFGTALKGNDALEKGVMTGILRLSKNKMLSDINNIYLYSFMEKQYSEYFGFSEAEVKKLFWRSGMSPDIQDVQYWYNGYRSGNAEAIYNPWSILNYIKNEGELKPYWIKTGDEGILREIFQNATKNIEDKIVTLLEGGSIESVIDDYVSFDEVGHGDGTVLWSLLWTTGYLKFTEQPTISAIGSYVGLLKIPNYEVSCSYRAVFPKWMRSFNRTQYDSFLKNLVMGNVDAFIDDLRSYMLAIPSWFDFPQESNYHTFLLGLTASLEETHYIHSNREEGLGRVDVLLIPKDTNHLGIILEFKKDNVGREWQEYQILVNEKFEQINTQKYDATLKVLPKIKKILKICILFYGKDFVYKAVTETIHDDMICDLNFST